MVKSETVRFTENIIAMNKCFLTGSFLTKSFKRKKAFKLKAQI